MSYADGLLSTGERILYRNKQHPFVFIWGARYSILALVFAFLVLMVRNSVGTGGINDTLANILGWATAILFFGGLAVAAWTVLRYINQEYVLTNRRVIQVEGVFNRNATDSSLEKINDAVLTQSIFGRIFGFGDLDILTASESGISRLRMLRQPDDFKRAMLDAKHDLELELSGARPLPSPALRAAAPTPTAPPAASAAPPSAAPAPGSSMSADDVTRTLANLADLRDRGAISADDYEAKKAELLRRL